LAGVDHDLLDEISGDSGGGSVAAPHHALVHLHQVLLLLHSKTALLPKSLPPLPVSRPALPTPRPPFFLTRLPGSFPFRPSAGSCSSFPFEQEAAGAKGEAAQAQRGFAWVFWGFWSGRPVSFFGFGMDRFLKTVEGGRSATLEALSPIFSDLISPL
jgi:hypothetical protein